jgi:hypothetical protein
MQVAAADQRTLALYGGNRSRLRPIREFGHLIVALLQVV